jgi:translation elongation factor EF-4
VNLLDKEEWITVHCKGVQLTSEERRFIESTLKPIVDLSPTHSSFKLDLVRRGEFVEGVLLVNSLTQKFVSTVLEANAYRVATELRKDLLRKIDFWRQSRFLSEAG